MSAVEEYEQHRDDTLNGAPVPYVLDLADAAIAELEVEKQVLFNGMAAAVAEVERLRNVEPIHKEFAFACPACGNEGIVSIDVLPRGSDE